MVLFRELKANLFVANHKVAGLRHEGTRGSLRGQELDNGKPLDGSVVGALLVLILRDVDVTEGAMLLKDASEFIGVDIAGQIASDKGLDFLRIVKGLRAGRENGRWRLMVAKMETIQLRIDRREIRCPVIRLEVCIHLSLLFR